MSAPLKRIITRHVQVFGKKNGVLPNWALDHPFFEIRPCTDKRVREQRKPTKEQIAKELHE